MNLLRSKADSDDYVNCVLQSVFMTCTFVRSSFEIVSTTWGGKSMNLSATARFVRTASLLVAAAIACGEVNADVVEVQAHRRACVELGVQAALILVFSLVFRTTRLPQSRGNQSWRYADNHIFGRTDECVKRRASPLSTRMVISDTMQAMDQGVPVISSRVSISIRRRIPHI